MRASRDITRPACSRERQQQRELVAGQRARLAVEPHLRARRASISSRPKRSIVGLLRPPCRGAGWRAAAPAARAARTAWADSRRRPSPGRRRGPWRRRAPSASGSAVSVRARSWRQTSSPSMSGSIRSSTSGVESLARLQARSRLAPFAAMVDAKARPAEIVCTISARRVVFDEQDAFGHGAILYQRLPIDLSCAGLTRASIQKRRSQTKRWMAGSSPAMTRWMGYSKAPLILPAMPAAPVAPACPK